ncbi:SDR family NAD(P)-dependent oxidoreductase [Saccharopolyspora mangrovi]|uniref:SDR family oxidoreductase n=1 Tax=Saccharopolyspora mangrovi TaxID=3082379 RepID=A0ABU6AI97_9PSEU|nr:SDR family oxidoreductase [Saccharopolyspora sp. S2-29]MEB3371277.1 SDR family oxidoreductase [Saccharopolyspora sp. S2-29]
MIDWTISLPDHVVVTGTASGLGSETARLLVSSGVHVYGVDTAEPEAELARSERFTEIRGSVTEPAVWDRVVHALRTAGPGDRELPSSVGFVGAAAVLDVGVLDQEDVTIWRKAWEINVLGNVIALQALLPLLTACEYGAVVAVSSINASFGEQQLAAYNSSKAALTGAIRTIALDYARRGVHINVLAPGPMRAGLFERHLASADDPAAFLADRQRRQPMGRVPGADEVAQAAAFLLSPAASAVFNTTLTADGGLTSSFDFREWAG